MTPCSEHREMLLLDVYGELDEKAGVAWKTHLNSCTGCQEERLRLLGLLGRLKESMTPPPIAPGHTEAVLRALREDAAGRREEVKGWGRLLPTRPLKWVPAMATLCVLVIATALFTFRSQEGPTGIPASPELAGPVEIMAEDMEIIKNFDLLRNIDWLQKLVQVMDDMDDGTPTSKNAGNGQGTTSHEDQGAYA